MRYRRGLVLAVLALVTALAPGAAVLAAPAAPPNTPAGIAPPRERPDDPPRPPGPRVTATPAHPRLGALVNVQVNVAANGANILGDAANEPSIAVDPTNPNHIAIGWRQFDTVLSNFRQAGVGFSRDAGRTWTFRGVLEPGVFRSDPVLAHSAEGIFYYSSLRSDFGSLFCDVFVSADGGATWSPPVPAFGGDKQWLAVDRGSGSGHGNVYEAWALAGACCGSNTFTRSLDGGSNWMDPVPVPQNPQWGSMDVGPDGALYLAGADPRNLGRIVVARSASAQDPAALPSFESTSTVNLGGSVVAGAPGSPNPDGLLGQVWVAVDHSDGPRAGNVYVLCSVDPPGPDPMDVKFVRSTDGGVTWSAPVRVNDDATTAWQWFATMSVAPDGRIDVVWNDSRDSGAANWSRLYYALSIDGGVSWTPNVPLTPAWNSWVGWPNQEKIGDYYHMISDRVGANLAWAATFNGEQDVWFLRIGDYDCNGNGFGDANDIAAGRSTDWNANGIPDECEGLQLSDAGALRPSYRLLPNVPNPFNPGTRIRFESPVASRVRVCILDAAGRLVRTLGAVAQPGSNALDWDGTDADGRPAASGVYFYRLEAQGLAATRRMLLVR